MGAAIAALPRSVGIVKRNPILLLGAVLFGGIVLFGTAFSFVPLVGGIIFQVVVLPLGLAGIVAMADAGATGDDASFDDFTSGVNEYVGSMIGAYGLMFLIQTVVVFLVLIVAVFVIGFGALGTEMATESDPGAAFASIGLLTILVLLATVLFAVVLGLVQQFLDVAVVIGGEDPAGALSESVSLITEGPLSVVGYSVLRFLVFGVTIGVPLAVAFGVTAVGLEQDTGALLLPAALLVVVAFPLGIAVGFAYHVAYYRERRHGESTDVGTASHDTDVGGQPSVDP
jgi:hypothetical protein